MSWVTHAYTAEGQPLKRSGYAPVKGARPDTYADSTSDSTNRQSRNLLSKLDLNKQTFFSQNTSLTIFKCLYLAQAPAVEQTYSDNSFAF